MNKLIAEAVGTFTLVSAVCGAGLFALPAGAGLLGLALAVGLAVLCMGYAVGHVSGGHFNPAVTLGLWAAGRFDASNIVPYIVAQVIGGVIAVFLFSIVLGGALAGGPKWSSFQAISNTYGGTGQFSLTAVFLVEVVATALLLVVVVGVTSRRAPLGFAPIAIGLAYVLLHLIALSVSNASLNPARSTATALFASGGALGQLPVFWIAPVLGGIIGGVLGRSIQDAS